MRFSAIVAIAAAFVPSLHAGPMEAVAAAEADSYRISAYEAANTRYLSLWHLPLAARRTERDALNYWANATSRKRVITQVRDVTAELVAVYMPHYAWSETVWGKLAEVEPYYTKQAKVTTGSVLVSKTKTVKPAEQIVTEPGFGVDPMVMDRLIKRAGTRAPVVRIDWFNFQIAAQKDRRVGYYDFLGVGAKRDAFDAVVGLDLKKAIAAENEISSIVPRRTPALNNGHIERLGTINGGYWRTKDAKKSTGNSNAIERYDKDFVHDAEEIYAHLPNRLFAHYLSSAAGDRADNAPDDIAPGDSSSPNNDYRIHASVSCVRCHLDGLHPIYCWFRQTYTGTDRLRVFGPERELRFQQIYGEDLDYWIKRDNADYAHALRRTNGLSPGDNAKTVARSWERYLVEPVTLERAAEELGCKPEEFRAAIRARGKVSPTLFGLGKADELGPNGELIHGSIPIRREHWEEVYQYAMETLLLHQEGKKP